MKRTCILLVAVFLSLLASPLLAGQGLWKKLSCKAGQVELDSAVSRGDAEVALGPTRLSFFHLNRLRYDVSFKGTTALTDGPDLKVIGFLPDLPEAPAAAETASRETTPGPAGVPGESTESEKLARDLEEELESVRRDISALLTRTEESRLRLQSRYENLRSLAVNSDSILATNGGETVLLTSIREMASGLDEDLKNAFWPSQSTVDGLRSRIEVVDARLQSDEVESWAMATSQDFREVEALQSRARELSETLESLEPGSEAWKSFEELRNSLLQWRPVLTSLDEPQDFRHEIPVLCGHPFFKNKTVTYEITRRDRTATDEGTAITSEKVITVECPSVASVTGGVGVSGLDERGVEIVSSKADDGTAVNEFGYKDRGSEQVNPIMLINTRLTDCPQLNWHASAGTVFDIDDPDSSVEIGYILGLTVSFRDTLFLTGGVQFGRTSRLAGGFDIGDAVPEGVSAPPLERQWDRDWVLTGSFKIN